MGGAAHGGQPGLSALLQRTRLRPMRAGGRQVSRPHPAAGTLTQPGLRQTATLGCLPGTLLLADKCLVQGHWAVAASGHVFSVTGTCPGPGSGPLLPCPCTLTTGTHRPGADSSGRTRHGRQPGSRYLKLGAPVALSVCTCSCWPRLGGTGLSGWQGAAPQTGAVTTLLSPRRWGSDG